MSLAFCPLPCPSAGHRLAYTFLTVPLLVRIFRQPAVGIEVKFMPRQVANGSRAKKRIPLKMETLIETLRSESPLLSCNTCVA
jgi:hypothetical protein